MRSFRIFTYLFLSILLTGCFGSDLFISTQTGNWEDGATWGNNSPGQNGTDYPTNNDDVVISSGTIVTHLNQERPARVTIENNAELVSSNQLRIRGAYVNDGTHSGTGIIRFQGANDSIAGQGIISSTGLLRADVYKVIYPGASLTRTGGDFRCPNNDTLSNRGVLNMGDGLNLTGQASTFFVNRTGGVLNTGGDVVTAGTLIASATNNTIVYQRSGAASQDIKQSFDGYYDLSIDGDDLASQKTLNADEVIINDLKINGSTLTTSDSFDITVGGNLTLALTGAAADLTTNQADVILDGLGSQLINGPFTFDDLILQNSGTGVTLAFDTVSNRSQLDLTFGSFNTNDRLRMISDAAADSRIGPVGGTMTGDVIAERYIDAGQTGWRFLCAPVQGATLADWNDDSITAGFPGSNFPTFYFSSIMSYNESDTGHQDSGFVNPTSITDVIPVTKAFWVYSGDSLTGTGAFQIDVVGPVNTGAVNYPVTYTNNTSLTADGWNHVSNPYISPIDWDSPTWNKLNVDDAIYIWNTDLNSYASYVSGVGVNGGTNVIASSQGFYVKANALNPQLGITEACKTTTATTFLRPTNLALLRLSVQAGSLSRETVIRWDSNATDTFDAGLDAHHLEFPGEVLGIHTKRSGFLHAVNSIPGRAIDTVRLAAKSPLKDLRIDFEKSPSLGVGAMHHTLRPTCKNGDSIGG